MHGRLVGRDPLPAELVRLAADLRVPDATADPVARLEHDDLSPRRHEGARGGEAGDARPDDRDVDLDPASGHPPIIAHALTTRSGSSRTR